MDDMRHKLKAKPTRFLDQLRLHILQQGLAYKTEQTYVYWAKRFIYFHNKQHPKNLGSVDVEAFLSHLAVNQFCSVNTQKIAPNALVYLYRRFMGVVIDDLSFSAAKAGRRLPYTDFAGAKICPHSNSAAGVICEPGRFEPRNPAFPAVKSTALCHLERM
jgi:hypothetical protein